MLLAMSLIAGESDPLSSAMLLEDGDAFATDRMEQAISSQPVGQRKSLVERLAAADREDVETILHRMILDEDPAAAAAAIDGLAKRWPTSMQDAELVRSLIPRTGPASDAACRFAAAINDDEALQLLADRSAARIDDPPSDQALRKLLGLPGGCGPDGWSAAVAAVRDRNAVALDKAEKLLEGSQLDAIAAITLVAGMRPIGTRATQVLLRAAEHPDHTVRNSAISILSTCSSPPAVAWRKQSPMEQAGSSGSSGTAGEAGMAAAPARAEVRGTIPAAATAIPSQDGSAGAPAWIFWLLIGSGALSGLAFWIRRNRKPAPAAKVTGGGRHITWAR